MTARFFAFGSVVSGCVDVCYIVLALELDAVTSFFERILRTRSISIDLIKGFYWRLK
jgi:hypothetical protein